MLTLRRSQRQRENQANLTRQTPRADQGDPKRQRRRVGAHRLSTGTGRCAALGRHQARELLVTVMVPMLVDAVTTWWDTTAVPSWSARSARRSNSARFLGAVEEFDTSTALTKAVDRGVLSAPPARVSWEFTVGERLLYRIVYLNVPS